MTEVRGDEALDRFRKTLTGRYGLERLDEHGGRLLINLPVGVGKSLWLDEIVAEALRSRAYDLVVVLCPTLRLIAERRRPPFVSVTLKRRPARMCGPDRDREWKRLEKQLAFAYGKEYVCKECPFYRSCHWPHQYGKRLEGVWVVYAPQKLLELMPDLIELLKERTGASRVLTLMDESDFALRSFEDVITFQELDTFARALRDLPAGRGRLAERNREWREVVDMLVLAQTRDLQAGARTTRWKFPEVEKWWKLAVQEDGRDTYGEKFKFIAYKLQKFAASPRATRLREHGHIRFAMLPFLGDSCIVFSATTDEDFARFRLGDDFVDPFKDHRFSHPGTRWYNIASKAGMESYFPGNEKQILDFFAELTARRVGEGKRVLLVAKKKLKDRCRNKLNERFARPGAHLRVVTTGLDEKTLADPAVVPLINYGATGTNLFEHFDCVFCLTGYYVNLAVVNHVLQDMVRPDLRLALEISTEGNPPRRKARVARDEDQFYNVARLAQAVLDVKERGVVVQAVGRVRPLTRPREVVTFQLADFPGVECDEEFSTLAQARNFFKVASGRARKMELLRDRIASLRGEGRTQEEVAEILGITSRTVRNYESEGDRKKSP
jgi:hypothetical protein